MVLRTKKWVGLDATKDRKRILPVELGFMQCEVRGFERVNSNGSQTPGFAGKEAGKGVYKFKGATPL
jgi:hypothetical protein